MSAKSNKAQNSTILDGIPSGLKDSLQFPLFDSIIGRRSRRFSLGAKIPDGPLKLESTREPREIN